MLNVLAALGLSTVLSCASVNDSSYLSNMEIPVDNCLELPADILVTGIHDYGYKELIPDYSKAIYDVYTINGLHYKIDKMYTQPKQDWSVLTTVLTNGVITMDSKNHFHSTRENLADSYELIDASLDPGCVLSSTVSVITVNAAGAKSMASDENLEYPTSFEDLEILMNEEIDVDDTSVIKYIYNVNGKMWAGYYTYEMPWLSDDYNPAEYNEELTSTMKGYAISFDEVGNLLIVALENSDEVVNGVVMRDENSRLIDMQNTMECVISTIGSAIQWSV